VSPHPKIKILFAKRRASPPGTAFVYVYKTRASRRFNYLHFSSSFFISYIPDHLSVFFSRRISFQFNLALFTISFALSKNFFSILTISTAISILQIYNLRISFLISMLLYHLYDLAIYLIIPIRFISDIIK
jgi:hypothetical protein